MRGARLEVAEPCVGVPDIHVQRRHRPGRPEEQPREGRPLILLQRLEAVGEMRHRGDIRAERRNVVLVVPGSGVRHGVARRLRGLAQLVEGADVVGEAGLAAVAAAEVHGELDVAMLLGEPIERPFVVGAPPVQTRKVRDELNKRVERVHCYL